MSGRETPSFYAGDLYGELALLEGAPRAARLALAPGLAAGIVVSLAAAFVSTTYGVPLILMGLLLGLAMSFVGQIERTHAGLDFCSRTVLRVGIVLLGLQVTLGQIAELGWAPFGALLAVMAAALGGGLLFARLSGQSFESGLLAGGATAICGASAALALYGLLGRRIGEAQFAVTLVGISLASAGALTVYPLLAQWLALSDQQAGFLTGAAIHDVAQAIGGGYAVSNAAGAYATIVKLSRVALLGPLIAIAGFALARRWGDDGGPHPRAAGLPGFIVLFLGVLVANSLVALPAAVGEIGLTASKAMLVLAVTATAMRTRLDLLLESGWKCVVPVFGATSASLAAALALVALGV
jgi:uncharacterized integral membrane protein (TIGR00698 family)